MRRRSFLGLAAAAPFALRTLPAAAAAAENPRIAADRQAALALLQPSARDLQHGHELHAQSVVVDTYGFGPQAAVDQAALARVIASGASEGEIHDAREEMMMTRFVSDAAERAEYEGAWAAAGVTAIIRNAGEEGNNPLQLMKRLARWVHVTDHLRARFPKAVRAGDIAAAQRAGHHAIVLTTNGVPLPGQWVNTRDELRLIPTFAGLGVRMMHVTYNRQNPLGTGCGEASDGGLTDFGRQAVAELNRHGMIADVSHSSLRTSHDTAKVSAKPMVASHSTAAALHPHIRAKTDEVIRAIADTGGLIGICCIQAFLGRNRDLPAFLDHIDHVARKFGVDHVGIGTDVGYASRLRPNDAPAPSRPPGRVRWEALWPAGALTPGTRDPRAAASLAWTNWPLFTVGLVQRGYPDDDIRKIIGGNMLRVLRANEA